MSASAAPAGAVSIKLALPNGEPKFLPDHVTAKAGKIIFFLENVPSPIASPDHNMQIGPAVARILARSPDLHAGDKVVFTVNDLPAGTYVYWCSIVGRDGHSHATSGMVGTLTITP